MKKRYRFVRKSYAMQRMAAAIERAIEAKSGRESDRALRWVAAWGLLCGIKTDNVRLRGSAVAPEPETTARLPSDQIEVPSVTAFTLTEEMVAKNEARSSQALQGKPRSGHGEGDELAAGMHDPASND